MDPVRLEFGKPENVLLNCPFRNTESFDSRGRGSSRFGSRGETGTPEVDARVTLRLDRRYERVLWRRGQLSRTKGVPVEWKEVRGGQNRVPLAWGSMNCRPSVEFISVCWIR